IDGFSESETSKELAKIGDLLLALEQLSDASRPPAVEAFDLTEAISILVKSEFADATVQVSVATIAPMEAVGNQPLLEIVARNGIRNAIEATTDADSDDEVVVAWGATDRDYWLVV